MSQFIIIALVSGAILIYDHFISDSGVNDIVKTGAWFACVISVIIIIGRQL